MDQSGKESVITNGEQLLVVPWSANCGVNANVDPADLDDIISKIDNVCACTINHSVSVTYPNDYAALNGLAWDDPSCPA